MSEPSRVPPVSRRAALGVLAGAGAVVATPALAVGAIKHYIIIELMPGVDQLVLDRFYITFHSQEVRRAVKAWQRNYLSFRSYLPPPEAVERYGLKYGRMTEIQFDSLADFRESRPNNIYGAGLGSYTAPPGGWRGEKKIFESTTATIPVNPQEMFVSLETPPKQTPYLRWIVFFRYPKSVTVEAGDAWYRDVHAKEVSALPGLKRFALYRTVTETAEFPRVAELWFDDCDAWRKAFLPAPRFTAPSWGGSYPFVETLSMFIGENPDVDFVNDKRVIP
jgi:hypothetical protein